MPYVIFEYMYRDASNYKSHASLWLTDEDCEFDVADFESFLEGKELFVAEQVGVPALHFNLDRMTSVGDDDHVWHSFVGFRRASEMPSGVACHSSCRQFIALFEAAAGNWRAELSAAYPHLG